MRKLNPDEAALWLRVAATIRPLKPVDSAAGLDPLKSGPAPRRVSTIPQQREMGPAPGRPTALGDNLDGGWERRLRAGTVEPDQTLDLHGMTMDSAWTAIDRLLERSWRSGDRVVLLITGRERPDSERSGRGRIRAAVRDWLAASRHAPHIAAVRAAHRRHGGVGSLYIIMRRY
ncbi:MAG: Smr/MutS family protein [Sphingomicrobium sp.]